MQTILIISPFFYPEQISTGAYNTALARSLIKRGCQVTVICSHPLYPGWKPVKSTNEIPGARIMRGGLFMRYPHAQIIRRFFLELWFAVHVFLQVFRIRNQFEIVVPIFPPNLYFLLVGLFFAKRCRVVAIVHDLQSVHASAGASGFFGKLVKNIIGFVENVSYGFSDRIVVLSNSMARIVREKSDRRELDIHVRYPFSTIPVSSGDSKIESRQLAEVLPPERIHVVYSGALGRKQNPEMLFLFLKMASIKNPEVWFHVFSEGKEFESAKDGIAGNCPKNLHLHGLVSPNQLPELYSRSDVQIIPQLEGTEEGAMPSKLPNIVAGGSAVFAICRTDSELAGLIGQYNLGVVISSWDPDVLVTSIGSFVNIELRQWKNSANAKDRQKLMKLFSADAVVDSILNT